MKELTGISAQCRHDGTDRVQEPAADRARAGLWRHGWQRYVSSVIVLCAWQAASWGGIIPPRILPSPLQILQTGWGLVGDGTLPANLEISLLRASAGLGLAVVVGVVLALVAGLSRVGENIVDAPLQVVRTLPALALVPLFILWFGIGEWPKILLVALGAMFPVYLNLHKGIRAVDPKLMEMASILGLSRWATIRFVVIPGAMPDFLIGLRFAVGISWLMLVVAEQVNAESGIGHMMMDAQDFLRTDIILVGLVIYGVLGLVSDQVVRFLETRLLSWRPASERNA